MLENIEYIKAKTGSEIARELNISRQAVSQSLKRAIIKTYEGLLVENICDTPTEAIMFMRDWFGVDDDEDLQQFYDLFPKYIKDDILVDARTYTTGQL